MHRLAIRRVSPGTLLGGVVFTLSISISVALAADESGEARSSFARPAVGVPVWSPERTLRPLTSTRVVRPSSGHALPRTATSSSSQGWTKPGRLTNTSGHLSWREPGDSSPQAPGGLKPITSNVASRSTTKSFTPKPLTRMNRSFSATDGKMTQPLASAKIRSRTNQDANPPRSRVILADYLEDVVPMGNRPSGKITAPWAPSPEDVRSRPKGVTLNVFQDLTPQGRNVSPTFQSAGGTARTSDPYPIQPERDLFPADMAIPSETDLAPAENSTQNQSDTSPFELDLFPELVPGPQADADIDEPAVLNVDPQTSENAGDDLKAEDLPSPFEDDAPTAEELNLLEQQIQRDMEADPEDTPIREFRQFSDRDCDEVTGACRQDLELLTARSKTGISTDITPSIKPREFDMSKVEGVREERLANAPSRTWRDRQGNVLAEGKLHDYRNEQVYVKTLNGSIQSFEPRIFSDEDWCFVTAWWELPPECRFGDEPYQLRDFRLTTFTWTAAATCHKPLYFEEVQLERYGHSAGPLVQPILSGAHFFGNVAMLPYKMGLNPPNECQYSLGYYRPGDCAPWLVHGFPISTRGLKWQGLAMGAAIVLLP